LHGLFQKEQSFALSAELDKDATKSAHRGVNAGAAANLSEERFRFGVPA
jgi:hypothetical protein